MRIDILAFGSQGDVRPYVALGVGLQRAGHRVRMVTLSSFEALVQSHDLEVLTLGPSPQELGRSPLGQGWIKQRGQPLGFLRGFVRVIGPLLEAAIARYWDSCKDLNLLIAGPAGMLLGGHIADRLRIPIIRTQLAPYHDWAGRATLRAALHSTVNGLCGDLFNLLLWNGLRQAINRARKQTLQLPALGPAWPFKALDRKRVPMLQAFSPLLVPPPAHWGDWIHVTGYWFLDDQSYWQPEPALRAFLAAGPKPLVVGFGSTPFPDPEAAIECVVRAVHDTGQRAVVLAGTSGLPVGALAADVLSVEFAPHDKLFARACAVVHHGGAGVTAATLRAGLPAVVIPVFADQPFWGQRVYELGAAPAPIPAPKLNARVLRRAIECTRDAGIRQRAAQLGAGLRRECGVTRAIEIMEQYCDRVAGRATLAHHPQATPICEMNPR